MNPERPRPHPTPTSTPFWDGLAAEQIRLQRCEDCGQWVFYPRVRCSSCLSDRLEWHVVGGEATLYTFTVAPQPTSPAFADDVPQLLAVVELAVGVRMSTTLVDVAPEAIRLGMALRPVFDHGPDGITLLRFAPVSGADG